MEWNVWVIKVYGITTGSSITVLREGEGNISITYFAEIQDFS
jgi:hypothetical protein